MENKKGLFDVGSGYEDEIEDVADDAVNTDADIITDSENFGTVDINMQNSGMKNGSSILTKKNIIVILSVISSIIVVIFIYALIMNSPSHKIKETTENAVNHDGTSEIFSTINDISGNEAYVLRQYIELRNLVLNDIDTDAVANGTSAELLVKISKYINDIEEYKSYLDPRLYDKYLIIKGYYEDYQSDTTVSDFVAECNTAMGILTEYDNFKTEKYFFTITGERNNLANWRSAYNNATDIFERVTGTEFENYDYFLTDNFRGLNDYYDDLSDSMDDAAKEYGVDESIYFTKFNHILYFKPSQTDVDNLKNAIEKTLINNLLKKIRET